MVSFVLLNENKNQTENVFNREHEENQRGIFKKGYFKSSYWKIVERRNELEDKLLRNSNIDCSY